MTRSFLDTLVLSVVWVLAGAASATAQPDPLQPHITGDQVARLQEARVARRAGDVDRAVDMLRRLTATAPSYYRAHYELGLSLAEQQKYEESVRAFEGALAVKDREGIDDATIYNSLGWTSFLAGDYSRAEKELLRSLNCGEAQTPRSHEKVLNNLGMLYIHTGDRASAKRYLERAVEQHDSSLARRNLKLLDSLKAKARGR